MCSLCIFKILIDIILKDENGLNIPKWTKSVFPEPMKSIARMNFESYTRTTILKRLQAGEFHSTMLYEKSNLFMKPDT